MNKGLRFKQTLSSILALSVAIGAAAPGIQVRAAGLAASGSTFWTDTDNWGGSAANSVADGDLDYGTDGDSRIGNGSPLYPIEFKLTDVNKQPQKSAYLLVRAYDVDEYSGASGTGEWDRIYMSDTASDIALGSPYTDWSGSKASGQTATYKREFKKANYIGALSGNNERWNTSVFSVNPSLIKNGVTDYYLGLSTHHYVNATTSLNPWVVTVDWAQLVLDGGSRQTGEITKGDIKVENGKVTVNTGFVPKSNGTADYAMEVSVIKQSTDAQGNVFEENLATDKKRFTDPASGRETTWSNIALSDASIKADEDYKVNIILFDNRPGGTATENYTNPGKAQHIFSMATTDPDALDFALTGKQYEPTGFTADPFRSYYMQLNGKANGSKLNRVVISTLPDAGKGDLYLNNTPVVAGQEIPVADVPNLQFRPAVGGFTGTASFKWNGFDGAQYAFLDAEVTLTADIAPVVGPIAKSALEGDTTAFAASDFTQAYLDSAPLAAVKLVSVPDAVQGTLKLGSTPLASGAVIAPAQLNLLQFEPAAGQKLPVSFLWSGSDALQYANTPAAVTITYNGKPTVQNIAKSALEGENVPFAAVDFTSKFTDPEGAQLQAVTIVNPPAQGKLQLNGADVAAGQAIAYAALDKLVYVPAAGQTAQASFAWNGTDGAQYASAAAQAVISFNGKPAVTPVTKNGTSGQPLTFTAADFSGSYVDAENAPIAYVRIVTLPAGGTLSLGSTQVQTGDTVPRDSLPNLTYTPAAGMKGTDGFQWTASDGSQEAALPSTVSITIANVPPVIMNVSKSALANETVAFAASDFAAPAYADQDGHPLAKVIITLPGGFSGSTGTLSYTKDGATITLADGSASEIAAADLGTLQFEPGAEFEGTATFPWKGHDGTDPSNEAQVTIVYNGMPSASPVKAIAEEGAPSIAIVLAGSDAETTSQAHLVYAIVAGPGKGTVTPSDVPGTWTYVPNPEFTGGEDTFSYTVTDANGQTSQPAVATVRINRTLDGWTGSKEQSDETIVKAIGGDALRLSAVSSLLATDVVANVNGTAVALTLANAGSYPADGFKRWIKEDYTLPASTAPSVYTVTYQALSGAETLPAEQNLRNNKFEVLEASLTLSANPDKIVGDGKTTTLLTAVLKDSEGNPIPGVTVTFAAKDGIGSFAEGINTASTDANGVAMVTYKSAQITGTAEQYIPITAAVHDTDRGLAAKDSIEITFQPAIVKGIVTEGKDNKPVPNAEVTVSLDINKDGRIEAGVDFIQTVKTDATGAYSVAVPKGGENYTVQITQLVDIGGVSTPVTYSQTAKVDAVTGSGGEEFASEKTVTGIVVFQQPDGKEILPDAALAANTKIKLKTADTNSYLPGEHALANGVFTAGGLEQGKEYWLEVVYDFGGGQQIVMSKSKVTVQANGEMNIAQELVDPYGEITNATTGAFVEGAKVTLYYADTPANTAAGKTANSPVTLPAIPGFAPNDNKSPEQLSDANGFYAYMVYPNSDYYLVVSKSGYDTYTSPVIHVGLEIVRHDLKLTATTAYVAAVPQVSLALSVAKNIVAEGERSPVAIVYKNTGSTNVPNATVTVTLPDGVTVVDAAGGTVSGSVVTWKVDNLKPGAEGKFDIVLEWPLSAQSDTVYSIAGQMKADTYGNAATAKSEVKINVTSNRFGNLKHQRYILGTPEGLFQPGWSLTRAELAAIVARLTENGKSEYQLAFTDIREGHWATNYIKIAVEHDLFSGFADGTFRPDAPVTRAELAVVMARFLKLTTGETSEPHFSDVSNSWAKNAVEALYRGKFLNGYADGTFKPASEIRRDEAVAMINRMLYRGPLRGLEVQFPDMAASNWAFGDVQEATVSHESVRNSDGSEAFVGRVQDDVQ